LSVLGPPSRTTIAVATVTLAVAAGALLATGGGEPAGRDTGRAPRAQTSAPVTHVSQGVGLLSAQNGAMLAFLSCLVVPPPVEALHVAGSFWGFESDPPTFVQIHPVTGGIMRRLRSPIADVGFFTVHGNELWITDEIRGDVTAIDVTNGRTLRTFHGLPGRGGSAGIAVSHGSLWVARPEAAGGDGILLRLDPRTGRVEHLFRALTGTYAVSAGPDGTVWTGGTFGQVNRIDPVTNEVVRAVTEGRNYSIAAGSGSVWTADTLKGVVYQVDTQGDVISQFETSPGARSVSFGDGFVWVGNRENGTVTRIDASGRESTYRFDHEVISIAAGSEVVMIGFGASVPVVAVSAVTNAQ
jgi:hypothetical protein